MLSASYTSHPCSRLKWALEMRALPSLPRQATWTMPTGEGVSSTGHGQ